MFFGRANPGLVYGTNERFRGLTLIHDSEHFG